MEDSHPAGESARGVCRLLTFRSRKAGEAAVEAVANAVEDGAAAVGVVASVVGAGPKPVGAGLKHASPKGVRRR